jgi:hypothetical protein
VRFIRFSGFYGEAARNDKQGEKGGKRGLSRNIYKMRIMLFIVILLFLNSCCPLMSRYHNAVILGVKQTEDSNIEMIIEKEFHQMWLVLLHPGGKLLDYISYKKYYIWNDESQSLNMLNTFYMDIPQKSFYSISNNNL